MPVGNDFFPKSQLQPHNHLTYLSFLEKTHSRTGNRLCLPHWMCLQTVPIGCVQEGSIFAMCRKIKTISKIYGYLLGAFVI